MVCDVDKSEKMPVFSVAFFTLFIVISTFMILSLSVGIITTSMQEAATRRKEEMKVEARILTIQQMCSLSSG